MKIPTYVDHLLNEIRNVLAHIVASDPSSPIEGQFWYNSTAKKFRGRTDTTTVDLNGAGGSGTVTNVTGTAPISVTNGTTTPAVSISTATGSAAGSMSAADKTKLDAATNANTAATLALRDASGNVAFGVVTATQVTGLSTPTGTTDAANKAYVDSVASGLDVKASVRAVATSNITLSGTQTIDGVALVAGDRVLVAGQTTAATNGIYVVASGAWSRAADADSSAEVTGGLFTFVTEGTSYGDSGWVLTTNDAITLSTTALAFAQFSGAGQITSGTGLTKSGNTLAIDTANGYGVRKAVVNVGDGSSTAITVAHNFNTTDVQVQVYANSSPFDTVYPDVERSSLNAVVIRFATAPTSSQYRAVITG